MCILMFITLHAMSNLTVWRKAYGKRKCRSNRNFSYLTCKVTTIYEEERLVNQTEPITLQTRQRRRRRKGHVKNEN